ncbi:hypothetical protein BBO_04226 [Beauveria brongniartii RCEF 3172]|uniref:Nuclear pore protein n=1 Tax=Beauveria brongniartii RCEF 3172 TaxID=1081107 RepID=A0A162LSF4_9HYPO|nr:hypothetical protein BBO_04226 [Beauveria brongniartii RCEF 3172]
MSICERTVILDNHGDIEVQVSGGTTRYIVCSRALARISPVLRSRMRQDDVSDTQDQCARRSVVMMQLDGNDDDSLTILFNIAHAHFLAVPRTLSIKQIYNLSILTSCYSCTSILGPWVDSWIAGVEGTVPRGDMAMMLWVFWELGFSGEFRTVAHRMTVELDASRLSDMRLASLQAIFDTTADMLAKLLLLEQCPRWSRFAARGGPQRCRQAMRAMMESSLGAAGLWPSPEVAGIKESLGEVYSKLVAVVSHNHMGCEFGQFWCRRIQNAMNAQMDQISGITKDDET